MASGQCRPLAMVSPVLVIRQAYQMRRPVGRYPPHMHHFSLVCVNALLSPRVWACLIVFCAAAMMSMTEIRAIRLVQYTFGMKLTLTKDYKMMCHTAVDRIEALVREKPNAVIGVPTGNTPTGVYTELAWRVRDEGLDLSKATVFQLDEYLDVPRGDARCFADWLERELIKPCRMDMAQLHILDGVAREPTEMCAAHEEAILQAGGLDMQLLGLGPNGHVGMNEPGCSLQSRTRIVKLTPASLQSNSAYWGGLDRVPRYGITMGVATILGAKEVIIIASGAGKAAITQRLVATDPTPDLPATLLKTHPAFELIVDGEAAALLDK
jgi:glucosamine-6-phosphate deaminase